MKSSGAAASSSRQPQGLLRKNRKRFRALAATARPCNLSQHETHRCNPRPPPAAAVECGGQNLRAFAYVSRETLYK